MLHEPYPTQSGRSASRCARAGSTTRTGSVAASSSATPSTSAPPTAASVAPSTLTKPWWLKPVSGSRCRIAWCSPAVSLNGSLRSRQAQITAASSTGVGNSSAASPPVRNLAATGSPPARASASVSSAPISPKVSGISA